MSHNVKQCIFGHVHSIRPNSTCMIEHEMYLDVDEVKVKL